MAFKAMVPFTLATGVAGASSTSCYFQLSNGVVGSSSQSSVEEPKTRSQETSNPEESESTSGSEEPAHPSVTKEKGSRTCSLWSFGSYLVS